jgi:hypothetical protein
MRIIIVVLAVMLAIPTFGQRRKKADEGVVPGFTEGITYALPRTGFRIHVEAVKETFETGPYATQASQLLGINDAKTRASVNWTIKSVQFEPFTEPDPEQVYKAMGEAAFGINLTPSGTLAGVHSKSSTGESLSFRTHSFSEEFQKNDNFSFANISHSPVYFKADSSANIRPLRMGAEGRATEAAERILECRTARYHIVAGLLDEFHPDGEAYKVSLRELEKIENHYLSLFIGRTISQAAKFTIYFIPSAASEKGEVVFRFSEDSGVLPASNLSGKPVMLRVEPDNVLVSKYAGFVSSENPDAGESGLFYRMPAVANVNLIYEMNTIANTRAVLPQFGRVAPIPEELLFGDYSIEIHPETGAVKSILRK